MEKQDIAEMHKQEQNYWWHIGRRFVLKSVLKRFFYSEVTKSVILESEATPESNIYDSGQARMTRREKLQIIDVGCGTGANLKWLKKFGNVIGIDNSQEAVKFCQKYGNAKWGQADYLPFKNDSCDLVTAFDVLEHMSNDKVVLKEWHRVLKIGGYLYITVPAYQWLFSPHDKQLQHYRRYLISNLSERLQKVGFKSIFASYFFMCTFPVFIIQRIASQAFNVTPGYTKVSNRINNFLIGLSKIEAWLLKFISFPFGSSIVILAKKNETTDN